MTFHPQISGRDIVTDIRVALGQEAALRVLKALGGQYVYIPKHPDGEGVSARNLTEQVGTEIAGHLCEYYGGCAIDFPSMRGFQRREAVRALRSDIRKGQLTNNELAAKHNVTRRWVQMLRTKINTIQNQGQDI